MRRFMMFFLIFALFLFFPQPTHASSAIEKSAADITECLKAYVNKGDTSSCVHVFDLNEIANWHFACKVWGAGCVDSLADTGQPTQASLQKSLVGYGANSIAYLYKTRPASTGEFFAYYGNRIGIVKPAYAQGIGFSGLQPLISLWRTFRNIAYLFLLIVMVVIGFLIMLRTKIDPRTVISVQNAIPRIVFTLIIVTFSYAIVGFLIDLMYVVNTASILAISSTYGLTSPDQTSNLVQTFSGGNLGSLSNAVFPTGSKSIESIVSLIGNVPEAISYALYIIPIALGSGPIGKAGLSALFPTVNLITTGELKIAPINSLVGVIVGLALLFTFIRIFLMLLNAYISVLLGLIFGPLQIMVGAIPNNDSISSWFKGLISNLAVFPATMLMLLIGNVVTSLADIGSMWGPPGISGSASSGLSGLIGLGILFVTPTIAGAIKEMLKYKPSSVSSAGNVLAPITSIYGTTMTGVSQVYYLSQLRSMFGSGKRH